MIMCRLMAEGMNMGDDGVMRNNAGGVAADPSKAYAGGRGIANGMAAGLHQQVYRKEVDQFNSPAAQAARTQRGMATVLGGSGGGGKTILGQ